MNIRAIAIALLVLGAGFSGALLWQKRPAASEQVQTEQRSGYVLHQFELVALDENGQESFSVSAPYLQETPGQRTIDLTDPVFLLPDSDNTALHWELRAERGWINEDQTEVRLHESVQGTSPEGSARSLKMTTEQLNVYPRERRATSDEMVTVVQPGSTITGRGMEALFSENRVTLKSQVKARYVPTR